MSAVYWPPLDDGSDVYPVPLPPGVREAYASTVATLLAKAREWERAADGQDTAARWCDTHGYPHGYDGASLRARAAENRARAARLTARMEATS